METKQFVLQAVENLQRAIAQSIKEDMPERSTYTTGVYYFGDATMYVSDSGKTVSLSIDCKLDELMKEAQHLRKAELIEKREELQKKLDAINAEIEGGEK